MARKNQKAEPAGKRIGGDRKPKAPLSPALFIHQLALKHHIRSLRASPKASTNQPLDKTDK